MTSLTVKSFAILSTECVEGYARQSSLRDRTKAEPVNNVIDKSDRYVDDRVHSLKRVRSENNLFVSHFGSSVNNIFSAEIKGLTSCF